MLSPESMDGLIAIARGDAYMKAHAGAQRAGRTRTLSSLLKRGLVKPGLGIGMWELTDAGRSALPETVS